MKRSGKFYRKNEEEVMQSLGLQPTPGSGSGWVVKEDGQSNNVVCQLKSTDANSIKISKLDLDKLTLHSITEHKLPVFAIQFLQSNEVFLLVRPEDIEDVSKYIKTGVIERAEPIIDLEQNGTLESISGASRTPIKSSSKAKEQYNRTISSKYQKKGKSAL